MELKKQNILFFTRFMGLGGTENVILQLCEIFKPLVNKIVVCSCGGVNVTELQKLGINHYEITDIENKSPITIISNIKKINEIIKNEEITVVHTHHRMAAFYVELMKLYKKCICINTCHNTFYNKKLLTKFAYKHINLITCGEMVKKNLVEYFDISGDKITVIHNAVKPFDGKITPDPIIKKMRKDKCFIVGNIGRLSEQKGMEYYIKAIPDVINKHPNTKFLVVGDGEDKEKLISLVRQLKIEEYVVFMGYRKDIQNIMSQIDLIVLSSLWEGLPLTPIEAFSVGKTIVATAVDGTTEIVEKDENGLLIKPYAPSEISDKINYLVDDRQKLKNLGHKAYKCFQNKFNFPVFQEKYIDYYRKV